MNQEKRLFSGYLIARFGVLTIVLIGIVLSGLSTAVNLLTRQW